MKENSNWRDVFLYSNNLEVYLDKENIRSLLPQCVQGDGDISSRLEAVLDFASKATQAWQSVLPAKDDRGYLESIETIVLQSAPMAAAAGAALQNLSAPSVFEDPPQLRLMSLLADDVGVGSAERWRFDCFRDIARDHEITSVTGSLRELSDQRAIRDGCFRLPALIYAMSRRSDVFDCELIGLDLAWRTVGLLPMWRGPALHNDRWSQLDLGKGRGAAWDQDADLAPYAKQIVTSISHNLQTRIRIEQGITIFTTLLADLDSLMVDIIKSISDPRLAMGILVQNRARGARNYHENFLLDGKPLSKWFEEAQNDPMPLVDAIGRSKLVRPNAPDRSILINGLIREGGSMFRIFTPADVATIRRWIASLATSDNSGTAASSFPEGVSLRQEHRKIASGDLGLGLRPTDIRSAYHQLQGRALPPRARKFANDYCTFWLQQSRASIDKTDRSLPQTWRSGDLREWLLASHEAHATTFESSHNNSIPTRDMVIDQTLQLAPLALIDGAWLQGFTDVSLASSRIGAPLFETYWDELGNGDWNINHPKVYREVLASMNITLPPTGSRAFAATPSLQNESFQLPVYWLCLGKLPVSMRPEILGMNLAMELSGVGGTYRNAHNFLRHYGFPTTFVDLHNTIDNVSTGHSAWAVDAIDAYMQTTRDLVAPEQSWARIRLGYESLAPIVSNPDDLDFFAYEQSDISVNGVATQCQHIPLQNNGIAE